MSSPALDYAFSVITGDIPACKYILLACKRFVADLNRVDLWYDVEAADRFYTFCTYLRHYKGPQKGQPIELELWQKFMFGQIYGFKRCFQATEDDLILWAEESNPRGDRLRELHPDGFEVGDWIRGDNLRFHYNYLEVPRKNGKTTIAAAAAAYDCGFMEETGAEVYCLATKEDQAKILWNDVRAFIKPSEDLKEAFDVMEGRNTVYAKHSNRTSFVKPLGANSERLDGLNPLSAVCDELHEWPDRKLLDVIEDAFGARINWHIIQITTAGYNRQGICYTERKHGIDILEGRIRNDDKLVLIYTVDEEDKLGPDGKVDLTKCLTDETIWHKANPNLGTGKQLEYMRSKAQKASQIPSELNTFLNKQLNVWTDAEEAWLKWDIWKNCHRTYDRKLLLGKKCIVGGDIAKTDDLSAVCYWFPVQAGLDVPHVLVDFYCPKDNVATRAKRDKVPYDVWVRDKWIKETPGNTTDFKFILHDILAARLEFEIDYGCFDRTFGGELIQGLMEEGMEIVTAGQGYMSMGPATAELERLLLMKGIATNNNEVLDWCAANVIVTKDPTGQKKPDKSINPLMKIDGIVAMLNAVIGQLDKSRKDPPKVGADKVYSKRGMRHLHVDDEKEVEARFARL